MAIKKLQPGFTNPTQSKQLLELSIPSDSADFYYDKDEVDIDEIVQPYFIPFNRKFSNYDERFYLPCWSVGRLMEIIDICEIEINDNSYPTTKTVKNDMKIDYIDYLVLMIKIMLPKLDFSKLEE